MAFGEGAEPPGDETGGDRRRRLDEPSNPGAGAEPILEVQRQGEFLSLVHRIDRETSGLLLVGRSREADRAFKRLL